MQTWLVVRSKKELDEAREALLVLLPRSLYVLLEAEEEESEVESIGGSSFCGRGQRVGVS